MTNEILKKPSLPERLLRLIYPVKCMICDRLLKEDATLFLCDSCHRGLHRCGKGFHRLSHLPHVEGILTALHYDESIDTAIHSMKFRNQPRLSETMSAIILEEIVKESIIPELDMIVPVPMHPGKKRQRGYNQSELVARGLSRFLGVPLATDILEKIKMTKPQVGLNREERLSNLEGAFKVKNSQRVRDMNILLVDDVITTGTTLNTCAKILLENDAAFVFGAVIAIAEK